MLQTGNNSQQDQSALSAESVFYLNPLKVNVNKDLPRFREDMGDVDELAISLKQKGQIQPIVLNKAFELIAGGRRLAACIKAQIDVLCIFNDVVDPFTMRELEIEENIQRKQFTPAEEFKAIAELHALKQERFGESVSGRKGGHTLQDTANLIGKSKAKVIEALALADAIEKFPELKSCKKASEIKKTVKAIEAVAERSKRSKEYVKDIAAMSTNNELPFKIYNQPAADFYEKFEKASVDIMVTDPPYGINIDKIATSIGTKTGGANSAGFKFDDSTEAALEHYKLLAEKSFFFMKPSSHIFVFCGPEYFWDIRKMFVAAGWLCHVKPLIWIKREVGQCNVPHAWPASCYEMLLYGRRVDSVLVKQGQPDWIECAPVLSSAKRHPTEKPITLIRSLIQRIAKPGDVFVDPFMGSGSGIEAACIEQCFAHGTDVLKESFDVTAERMVDWKRNHDFITSTCNIQK